MKIQIAVVGRLKEDYFQAAEAEYLKRLRPYGGLSILEHKSEEALLRALPPRARLFALDERGPSLSSAEFAHDILGREEQHGGGATLVFAIGGADGHSEILRRQAVQLLSFGRATIAHRLVRLVLLEQIYRGYRILRGEPYHRE